MSVPDRADRFYSRWARLYDLLARQTPGIAAMRQAAVAELKLASGETVVEMGCGPGPNMEPLRDSVGPEGTVIGIDVARGALERAAAHVSRNKWNNVHPIRADATKSPLDTVDAVFAGFVIGMFTEPAEVVNEWCDLVGPGGRIGLVHFARGNRRVPNALLRLLVVLSTPGRSRFYPSAIRTLDERIATGHRTLDERCIENHHSTHWGGILHIRCGTVAAE